MPNIVKGATGAALGTPANWVGGALPLTTDIAEWQSTPTNSLGPSLTGSLNVGGTGGGVLVKGASNNITHSGGTITLGSGGYTQTVGNNRIFTTTGTISVAGNQTWTLYNPTGSGGLIFTGFTGTGNINVQNADTGASGWGSAYFVKQGATSTHTGTISLKTNTGITLGTATARLGTGTTISVDGEGCLISGFSNNVIYTYNNAGIVVNGDYCAFGNGTGRTILMTCPLTLNGNRKVYSYHNASVSGTFTATSGFELLGPAGFHLWCPANIGGTVKLTSGWIVLGSNVNSSVAPDQFNNVSIVDIAAGAYVQFMGGTNSATITSQLIGNGSIYVNSTGGITFNNPDSTHSGSIETAAGSGFVAPKTIFTYTPTSPYLGLTVWNSVTAATSVAPWIVFQSGGTISNSIRLLSQTALTGSQNAYIIETNGNNSTLTQDIIQRADSSPAAARIQVQLQGTGDNTVLQGRIIPSNLIGTVGITKTGTGKWTLENSSTCNGLTSLNQGTLVLKHNDAIGTAAGDVTLAGGTLQLSGGRNIVKTNRALTFGGASILVDAGTDGNSITCGGVTLNASAPITVGAGSTFTLSNSGAIIGSGIGLVKNGEGELILPTASNTFTGNITVNAGSLTVGSISDPGSPSSWGAGSGVINVPNTLKINGTGGSTTRTINLSGITSTIDSSGTNPVTFSSVTQSNSYKIIYVTGTNTGDNTISSPISNSSVSLTQLVKDGPGKWKLTGALTYTGITEVNEGTLNIGSISQTFANDVILYPGSRLESDLGGSCSGVFNCTGAQIYTSLNTFSVTLNGTSEINGVLSGVGSLYVNAGTTTIVTPSTNTYNAGTSTIVSGSTVIAHTLQNPSNAEVGKVFGNSALSVNGTLKTGSSANQQGKVRYGGNISFGSGAQIHIGGA